MHLKIKLPFLDKIPSLSYSNPVPILLNNNPDEHMGVCIIELFNGIHFGILNLNEGSSLDLYLYYFNRNVNDGVFHISHLGLYDELRKDVLANKIKDLLL